MATRSHDGKGFLGRGYYSIHCGICLQGDMIEDATIGRSEAVRIFRADNWHRTRGAGWVCDSCFEAGKHREAELV
jgi:hypothetical protein